MRDIDRTRDHALRMEKSNNIIIDNAITRDAH